jgi:hypothetical protein
VAADKGHHSGAVLAVMSGSNVQTYLPELEHSWRNWSGREAGHDMVCANRRRGRSKRGQPILKLRSELVERSFAQRYETSGMRRTQLLIHAAAFNVALRVRKVHGIRKPRTLQGRPPELWSALLSRWRVLERAYAARFGERAVWEGADGVAA